MQQRLFRLMIIVIVLLTACQPIQPGVHTAAVLTPDPRPDLSNMPTERWSATAPSGQWTAEGLAAYPKSGSGQYYTELRVRATDSHPEWIPVARWQEWGLGHTIPQPLQWSPDGRYLFFTNAPIVDGCGIFTNADDLQQLDLVDGTVSQLLPPHTTWAVAVAPNGKRAAYSQPNELHLLDLNTATDVAHTIEELEAGVEWGNFVWSPNSQQVAFTIAHHPCMGSDWSHSLLLFDTNTLTFTTVLAKDPRRLTITTWVDADQLTLDDYDGKQWLLDLTTGAIEETTHTD